MTPSPTDFFWGHVPGWEWQIIIWGIAAFFAVQVYHFIAQVIKGSEGVAKLFGRVGVRMHNNAGEDRRILKRLERSSDKLECATAYLVDDAEWHDEADDIIDEHCPRVMRLLPKRIPFEEYAHRWRDGWRPSAYEED